MKSNEPGQGKLQEALATLRPQRPRRDLSAQVRHRLENPEPPPPPTLMQRLGFEIEARPVLVGLSGAALCLLLVAAVLAARNVKPPEVAKPVMPPEFAGQPNPALGQMAPPVTPGMEPSQVQRSTDPMLINPASTDRVPMRGHVPAPEVEPGPAGK